MNGSFTHQKIPHQKQVKLFASLANQTAVAGTNRSNLLEIARSHKNLSRRTAPTKFRFPAVGTGTPRLDCCADCFALVQLAAGAVTWIGGEKVALICHRCEQTANYRVNLPVILTVLFLIARTRDKTEEIRPS